MACMCIGGNPCPCQRRALLYQGWREPLPVMGPKWKTPQEIAEEGKYLNAAIEKALEKRLRSEFNVFDLV